MQDVDVGIYIVVFRIFNGEGLDPKIHIEHFYSVLRKILTDVIDGFCPVDKLDLHLFQGVNADDALQKREHDDDHNAVDKGNAVIAKADDKAETAGHPKAGGSGKAGYFLLRHKYGASAQKADAADYLRAHPADADGNAFAAHAVGNAEAYQAFQEGDRGCAQADQRVCAHARGSVFVFSFNADECANQCGHQQPYKYLHSLRGACVG